ncbi:MAG: uracil phosphoribosyltransferase [Alistipes sp.]|jgi:uracil phosphoribosyltransferase|nr:uracil phosphoribosyltransferase [Alistipes sp.]
MLHILDKQNSIINKFLAELRNVDVQKDSMRFRRNLERIGECTAYELSKHLNYAPKSVTTPLAEAEVMCIADQVVVASILRAGLPLHQGLLNYFDDSHNAFVSAYRSYTSESEFEIKVEYIACPSLEGKTLILADPMLASGTSMIAAYEALCARGGKPAKTHIVSVLGCEEGVNYVLEHTNPAEVDLWVATVDPVLNPHKYIVPGLGDAGDLCFGDKL